MHKGKKTGIFLILVGLCLLLVSFAFISYNPHFGVLGYLSNGELVFKEGYSTQAEIAMVMDLEEPAPAPRPFGAPVELSYKEQAINKIKAKERPDEIRIAFPYKYFFVFDIILIFMGIGIVILYKSNKKGPLQA